MSEQFSDEQAKAILARAIELDSRAPTATADDLRAIAADLGVSHASLEAAMREHATRLTASGNLASKRAAAAVAGLGLPLGLGAGALLGSGSALAALGLMGVGLVASGGLVVLEGAAGTLRSFHLKNLVLWGGVAAGSLLSAALFGAGGAIPVLVTAGWCARSWIASSIVGSAAMIAVRRARNDSAEPGTALVTSAEATGSSALERGARHVLGWLARPLRRTAGRLPFLARKVGDLELPTRLA